MPSRTPYLAAALAVAFTLSTGALALAQTAPATPAATMAPVKAKHSKKTAAATADAGTTPAATAAPMASTKLPADAQFSTVAAATAHCPGDTVVWSTMSKSKSFHLATSKYYGKTKHGAYACEKDLTAAGFHASKS